MQCLDITKYTIHNKCEGKSTLVCKKYCKTRKKSFCSRGVLEETRLNLNGDFGKVILYTKIKMIVSPLCAE